MLILAIDPGDRRSAAVVYDTEAQAPKERYTLPNEAILGEIYENAFRANRMVIEMVACYGMPVGKTVFDTCVWIGRFVEAWMSMLCVIRAEHEFLYRRDVKMHLCHSMRAKDSNIRQALIDRFGAPGTKKAPGTLYGIHADEWSALAVAVTWADNVGLFETAEV